jgi:chromate transport protein ChrA
MEQSAASQRDGHDEFNEASFKTTSSSVADAPTSKSARYMDHLDGPAIRPPPTVKEQVVEIASYIHQQARILSTRTADLVVLGTVLFHLCLVFVGLVLLAYDPYRDRHPALFSLVPIIVILLLLLSHIYLLETGLRFLVFGFQKNAWHALDALLVLLLVVSQWLLRSPECIMASVLVGGRLWRLLLLIQPRDIKESDFKDDKERLMYLGASIQKEKDRNWVLTSEMRELKRDNEGLKRTLEVTVNSVIKGRK